MDYIIGVDIGTSGTKAVAFGMDGEVVGEHRITYPILSPQPGYFEQDPEVLFSAVVQSISNVVQAIVRTSPEAHVLGVGFSSAMHGLIVVDESHKLLTNCIIWADTRSEPFAARLKDTPLGHDCYLNTGTPIHPMSPLCKLGWMREHQPDIFAAGSKFISLKEYVFFKLFGQYLVDESIASATGLFDIHTLSWYAPALELAGVSPDQLSTVVPITYTVRGMDKAIAAAMHIPEDTPFVLGGSDGCLANLGVGAVHPGDAAVTIGTSGAIRTMFDRPKTDDKARTFSYVLTGKRHVLGGAVNSGGVVLQWYRDNFGAGGLEGENGYDSLFEEASTVSPGAEGLVFLPYLAGERAPHWNAEAKGLFFGVSMHHTKAHFTRAVLEGIVYGVYSVGKVLEELTGSIKVIYANGGFARSPLWVQLLADVFNKPVYVQANVESAAKGAYLVVLEALGQIADFDAVEKQHDAAAVFTPDIERHHIYMVNVERFMRLYEKVKDEF